ncbi:MAG: DUF58 domain-containing protein, partial [Clostridiales bacterium]|nr:DUF58 domain-containing protein [Clostridiales bacterium]
SEYCLSIHFTGNFFIPVKINAATEATANPKPTKPSVLPDSELLTVTGYKAKPGGGYSDYYELRSYRNGDSLKQIHWKLSGKYDNIIVRSPSIPIYKSLVVQVVLSDNADINDDILARFIYASNFLCKSNTEFYACASISNGLYKIKVFEDALDFLRMIYRGADLIQAPSERESSVIYAIYGDKEEVVTG